MTPEGRLVGTQDSGLDGYRPDRGHLGRDGLDQCGHVGGPGLVHGLSDDEHCAGGRRHRR